MRVNCIVVYEYQEEPAKFVIAYLREVWLGGDSDPRYDPHPQDLEDVREPKTPSILDRAPFFHVTCSPLQRYWRVGTARPLPPIWPCLAQVRRAQWAARMRRDRDDCRQRGQADARRHHQPAPMQLVTPEPWRWYLGGVEDVRGAAAAEFDVLIDAMGDYFGRGWSPQVAAKAPVYSSAVAPLPRPGLVGADFAPTFSACSAHEAKRLNGKILQMRCVL